MRHAAAKGKPSGETDIIRSYCAGVLHRHPRVPRGGFDGYSRSGSRGSKRTSTEWRCLAAEVLHAWRGWTATVPDEVTSIGHILRLPPLPELPEPLRGRAFAIIEAACLGDAGTGAELIGPARCAGSAQRWTPSR